MPLTINVGLSKKLGLPDYGSVGASCNIQLEADHDLLHDLESLHAKIKHAYIACSQAVKDELFRQQGPDQAGNHSHAPATSHSSRSRNGNGHASNGHGSSRRSTRSATASQVRALQAIAHKQDFDLADLLHDRFNVASPEQLTLSQASDLIDELNSQASKGR
jgi:hypothetical protein